MKKQKKKSEENGNGINLKHFIYLDKNRLDSYSSQLLDGLTQIRRITENTSLKTTNMPNEKYAEETEEDGKEGEISLGPKAHAGGFSGKGLNKTIKKSGIKEFGETVSEDFLQGFSEDKIDYHNSYLLLENELIQRGIIKEIDHENQLKKYSSLIKLTGISKFFDWESIMSVYSDFGDYIGNTLVEENQIHAIKLMLQAVKKFSLGEITLHTRIDNSILISALNTKNLCMTKEQLRASYVMPGDVETTIVGFVPKRRIEQSSFPGIAGTIDMVEIWKQMAGDVQTVIDPVAIYTEIHI